MSLYFISTYQPDIEWYDEGWYGDLDFTPPANVLLYNDVAGYCIGTIEESYHDFRKRMILEYWAKHEKLGTEPMVKYDIDNYELPETFKYITEKEAAKLISSADLKHPKIFFAHQITARFAAREQEYKDKYAQLMIQTKKVN